MAKRATLADVAQLSGLSPTTVSMVLNDRPNTRLSQDAAERVRAAAAKLNYRPNPAARGLRLGKTRTVGFISDEVTITRYASAMIRGLLEEAEERDHTVLISESGRRTDQIANALDLMLDRQTDGIVFGLMGANLAKTSAFLVPATAALLCFIMGLQNAMVTKISQAVVRTTHMTGVITDLGIELGKLLYWNRGRGDTDLEPVLANREKLRTHALLLASFASGGLGGALAFQWLSFAATVPLALLLAALAAVPIIDDLQAH